MDAHRKSFPAPHKRVVRDLYGYPDAWLPSTVVYLTGQRNKAQLTMEVGAKRQWWAETGPSALRKKPGKRTLPLEEAAIGSRPIASLGNTLILFGFLTQKTH